VRSDATTRPKIEVVPLSKHTGAELRGVDLMSGLDDDVVAEIEHALLRWKVVFVRGQHLSRDAHVALGERFGTVEVAHPTLPPRFPDRPEILVLEKDARRDDGGAAIDHRWHTDLTYVAAPPMGSILRAVDTPPFGGDTEWTNLAAAYEALSAPMREMIDRLSAVHENVLHVVRGEPTPLMRAFMATRLRAVHPVVTVHPRTGERVLYVNPDYTSYIVELSRHESDHLLACLTEHLADRDFSVRFRWEPGDVAFWDNRASAHRAPNDVPEGHHRVMERITITGVPPVGVHGMVSRAFEPDAEEASGGDR
jgi:alpha-ketoglutarate-dependent taurine dioxygenase